MTQESKHSQSSNNSEIKQEQVTEYYYKKSSQELELMKNQDTIEAILSRKNSFRNFRGSKNSLSHK